MRKNLKTSQVRAKNLLIKAIQKGKRKRQSLFNKNLNPNKQLPVPNLKKLKSQSPSLKKSNLSEESQKSNKKVVALGLPNKNLQASLLYRNLSRQKILPSKVKASSKALTGLQK